MMLQSSFLSWIDHFLEYMCGCFGSGSESIPIVYIDDFWNTSTCDIDLGALQLQRSLSSLSASNANLATGIQSDFVNDGLILWNQSRLEWGEAEKSERKELESAISWNATYESLLGTNKRFHKPVPLNEMVEFLVDIWKQEGLYD